MPSKARSNIACLVALLMSLGCSIAQSQSAEYVHTDALGSIVATTDQAGNLMEQRRYEPFGYQLLPAIQNGPGYTGHVQDEATGLTYMQQRYYDAALGRFLSVDPVLADGDSGGNFNRYWYANNNPYRFKDPDGRECVSADGTTRCTPYKQGDGLPQEIVFPTPDEWPDHTSDTSFWAHEYRYESPTGKSEQSVQQSIVNDPTTGDDRPTTPEGTPNDAGPQSGLRNLLTYISDSPVRSHTFVDDKGNTWTVNVTEKGHPLFPGFVLRGAVDGKIITYGQGVGKLQAGGAVSQLIIDNVWLDQNQANLDNAR